MTMLIGRRELVTCRGCGCDDNHACVTRAGPCSWTLLDVYIGSMGGLGDAMAFAAPTGVCSNCAQQVGYHPLALAAMGSEDPREARLRATQFALIAPALLDDADTAFDEGAAA